MIRAHKLILMKRTISTVVVGMSGGVDSSVSALLLKEQGYNVKGMFMKNWNIEEEKGQSQCPNKDDYLYAKRVCEELKIPLISVEFEKEYWNNVFTPMVEGYKKGITPNPDVLCNREIKFKYFLQEGLKYGDYIATGHYCRNEKSKENDYYNLLRGIDRIKDQSYFLCEISGKNLSKVKFPVGHLYKSQVREIAKKNNLFAANRKDSYGICFIGQRKFKDFMKEYIQPMKGKVYDNKGKYLGDHNGYFYYTIGQRYLMGGLDSKYYIYKKDVSENELFVCPGKNNPCLLTDYCVIKEMHWINPYIIIPNHTYLYKARYRVEVGECKLELKNEVVYVYYTHPQRAATPGQVCVLYDGEVCMGGGEISECGTNYEEMNIPIPSKIYE